MTRRKRRRRNQRDEELQSNSSQQGGKQSAETVPLNQLKPHRSNQALQRDAILAHQQRYGNARTDALLRGYGGAPDIQRNPPEDEAEAPEYVPIPGGRGPGQVTGATEQYYTISGATLTAVNPQLAHFSGEHAAQTTTEINMGYTWATTADGTYEATITWSISSATAQMPEWGDYDGACTPAQQEWDRFMGQLKVHEQSAHITAIQTFLDGLPDSDKTVTGATQAEMEANLQTKRADVTARQQAIHDACDHGVAIGATLHPSRGTCADTESEP